MKKNSLANRRPDLIKEWHPTKNGDLTPYDVAFSNHKKAWWICSKKHEWQASIANRARLNRNCPYCTHQKVLVGQTDLAATNPKLAKEWDYEKNDDLTPKDVFEGSNKKVWWICSKKHEWQASIKSRSRGVGCPYCSNKKPKKGFNDLLTVRPDLAAEWHPTKNDFGPDEVTFGSGTIAWWICKNGHEYKCKISDRNAGRGCKICMQRRHTSFPEQALYFYIKKIFPDAINGYRDIFNNGMELDIYIPSIKTGIEYDGKRYHRGPKSHDKELRKYNVCAKNGIRLIRVKEELKDEDKNTFDKAYSMDKLENRKQLELQIQFILDELDPESNPLTRKYANKFYSDVRVNLKKDNSEILGYLTALDKSLLTMYPEVAKEWHPIKNDGLKPEMFHPGSNEKVWWICSKCGHEWKTLIRERTINHTGCAICGRKTSAKKRHNTNLKNKRSVAETNPKLLKRWNYEKNTIRPNEITEGSGDKVWWKCPTCGYEWQSTIGHVKRNDGCPYCNSKVVIEGENDLKSQYPKLMNEWDYKKNKDLNPSKLLPGSGKYAWWICHKCGYEWKTKILVRTTKKCNCPKCRNK